MRRLRKCSAILFPALALGGALTVAPAFAAPAPVTPEAGKPSVLGCGDHRHENKDGGSGHAQGEQVNIYSGPHNNCNVVDTVNRNPQLNWHCFVENEQGNKWTYLGVHNTGTYGWVYSGHLTGGGSSERC